MGLAQVQSSDFPDEPFGPPGVTVRADGYQVRGQPRGIAVPDLVLVERASGGVLRDQGYGAVVFGEPDVVGSVDCDPVWLAVRGGGSDFGECPSAWIEGADLVAVMLREPDPPVGVNR